VAVAEAVVEVAEAEEGACPPVLHQQLRRGRHRLPSKAAVAEVAEAEEEEEEVVVVVVVRFAKWLLRFGGEMKGTRTTPQRRQRR
jgi:hypothetical protein